MLTIPQPYGGLVIPRARGIGGNDAYTSVLLHFDGSDGSTSFVDSSSNGLSITASGNAQIDNAQSKFGGTSLLLDGTGDYAQMPASSTPLNVGTGDFTIDAWVRSTLTPNLRVLFKPISGGTSNGAGTSTTGKVTWWKDFSSEILTSTTTITSGSWFHVAYTRSGTTFRLFVNGTQEASVTNSDSFDFSSWAIGKGQFDSQWSGWIDEFRISKGIARWTSNFTPPTQPYS